MFILNSCLIIIIKHKCLQHERCSLKVLPLWKAKVALFALFSWSIHAETQMDLPALQGYCATVEVWNRHNVNGSKYATAWLLTFYYLSEGIFNHAGRWLTPNKQQFARVIIHSRAVIQSAAGIIRLVLFPCSLLLVWGSRYKGLIFFNQERGFILRTVA